MPRNDLWTREQLIVTLNLYLKLPFGKLDSRTKEVIDLSKKIGRSANAVAMRLNNYAAVDPYHQSRGIVGLQGGRKQVEPIFQEFINNREELLFESEKILAYLDNVTIEEKFKDDLQPIEHLKGDVKFREVKTRVNQNAFRQIVLANYNNSCAISGIDVNDFLIASHIIPWSENEKERLNPENGICFSSLYDKAFDKGYFTLNQNFEVILSKEIKKHEKKDFFKRFFKEIEGTKIHLPKKYYPNSSFLEYHRDVHFKK
jgi:putative restriction endonuclease